AAAAVPRCPLPVPGSAFSLFLDVALPDAGSAGGHPSPLWNPRFARGTGLDHSRPWMLRACAMAVLLAACVPPPEAPAVAQPDRPAEKLPVELEREHAARAV